MIHIDIIIRKVGEDQRRIRKVTGIPEEVTPPLHAQHAVDASYPSFVQSAKLPQEESQPEPYEPSELHHELITYVEHGVSEESLHPLTSEHRESTV